MPRAAPQTENTKICGAALRLIAAKEWDRATLDAVAKAAKIPLAQFKKRFATKNDLIPVILEEIDRKAIAAAAKTLAAPHDVLFDLLMARFDILQTNRKAILSIAAATLHDPFLSRVLARAVLASAHRLASATKISTPSPPALAIGLVAVHGWTFLVWSHDESCDMSKTMAALDRALKLAGHVVGLLKARA